MGVSNVDPIYPYNIHISNIPKIVGHIHIMVGMLLDPVVTVKGQSRSDSLLLSPFGRSFSGGS